MFAKVDPLCPQMLFSYVCNRAPQVRPVPEDWRVQEKHVLRGVVGGGGSNRQGDPRSPAIALTWAWPVSRQLHMCMACVSPVEHHHVWGIGKGGGEGGGRGGGRTAS